MTARNMLMAIAIVLLGGCVLAGCAAIEGKQVANPATTLRVDPARRTMEFSNNKDVDLTIDKASFSDADGRSFALEGLNVKDNASTVRQANVPQIAADTERLVQTYAGIVAWSNSVWSGVNQLAATVAPYVPQTVLASALGRFRQVTTPLGSYSSGLAPGAAAGLLVPTEQYVTIDDLAAMRAELLEAIKSTTKPAE